MEKPYFRSRFECSRSDGNFLLKDAIKPNLFKLSTELQLFYMVDHLQALHKEQIRQLQPKWDCR